MTRPSRGEVWWFDDPDIGRRPGVVLTRDSAIDVLSWVLVAPVTRTVRDIPTEVALDESDGMPALCAVSLDNLRPVRRSLLTQRITVLDSVKLHQVCRALSVAVDC